MNNAAMKTYSRLELGTYNARHLTAPGDYALRAELSRAKLLATCCVSRPLQAAELVRNPIGSYMRFCGAGRSAARVVGPIAAQRFLSQLG